jgi:hypothetical protein
MCLPGALVIALSSCGYDLGPAGKGGVDGGGGRAEATSDNFDGGAGQGGVAGGSGGVDHAAPPNSGGTYASRGGSGGQPQSGGGTSASGGGSGGQPQSGGRPDMAGAPGSSADAGVGASSSPDGGGLDGAPSSASDAGKVDGIPTDGLLLWLRADRGVVEQAGYVSTWRDQSGRGMDATQVVPALRPILLSTAGVLAVSLDGKSQYLNLPATEAHFSKGLSFFVAGTLDQPMKCASIIEMSSDVEVNDIALAILDGAMHFEVQVAYGDGPVFDPAKAHVLGVIHRVPGDAEFLQDGKNVALLSIAPMPVDATRGIDYIGQTTYYECSPLSARLHELLLYTRSVSAGEATAIQATLASRWIR